MKTEDIIEELGSILELIEGGSSDPISLESARSLVAELRTRLEDEGVDIVVPDRVCRHCRHMERHHYTLQEKFTRWCQHGGCECPGFEEG